MRWPTRWSRHRLPDGAVELTEEIRLVRAQLTDLTVTLRDFDKRLTAVAERIHPRPNHHEVGGDPR